MQTLYYSGSGTQTIAVWPDVTASYANNPSVSYELNYSSDYDKSSGKIDLTLLNTPTSVTPRLVFSFDKSELPQYTGNYTITIAEALGQAAIWGQINETWGAYQGKWSDTNFASVPSVIDTDRAWISGSDVPSYTQYSSPDETGAYTTYHG